MPNKTSQHILGTSSNLLGFCLIVLTSLHVAKEESGAHIDDVTSVVALLLAMSTLLSFLSLRSSHALRQRRYEFMAELLFFTSLIGCAIIIVLIACNYWGRK